MTSKLSRTCAVIFAVLTAAPTYAGGLSEPIMTPEPAPVIQAQPVVEAPGWGGLYLGGQVGIIGVEDSDGTTELDGTFYGVHAGYMHDFGNFVLGAEVDYDMFNLDELTQRAETTAPLSSDIDEDGTVLRFKARAGYNLGTFLPYLTAGVATLELDSDFLGLGTSETDGSFIGVGGAFRATENVLISGELLQHQFDDAFDTEGLDLEATTVSLRASYRF